MNKAYTILTSAANSQQGIALNCPDRETAIALRLQFYNFRKRLKRLKDPNLRKFEQLTFSIKSDGGKHQLHISPTGGNLENLLALTDADVQLPDAELSVVPETAELDEETRRLLAQADKAKGDI